MNVNLEIALDLIKQGENEKALKFLQIALGWAHAQRDRRAGRIILIAMTKIRTGCTIAIP
jgi:hypothetical protein